MSENSSLKVVKKRLVDHLRSAGLNITMDEIRLWLHSEDNMNPDRTNLEKLCARDCYGVVSVVSRICSFLIPRVR